MQMYFIAVYSYSMLMYINDQKFILYLIKNIQIKITVFCFYVFKM